MTKKGLRSASEQCYELLDHTADLGVRVWGADLKELFTNSALAMYTLIADLDPVGPSLSFGVDAQAENRDELLKNWLSELLYYFHVKDILFREFIIDEISDKNISSVAKGEKIDKKRHNLKHEVKAVTYHNLKIEQENNNLATDIIFDI